MNAVEIKDLRKSFKDFDLEIQSLALPEGCIMGLIGENGAGKSTTIRLILGMLKKEGGNITLLGKDNGQDIRLLKEEIGVVTDDVGIPECLDTAKVGKVMKHTFKNWDEGEYARLTKRFSLPENKPFKDFSKGMKMKLGIAVAMSHKSRLLLLDEATSGLDPVVRDEVLSMLCDFTREPNHSVLMSSHIVSDLEKICDYIAFLHRGKLILCEEKDALLAKYGIIMGSAEQLSGIDAGAVKYKKTSPYGTEALVLRSGVPRDMSVIPVNIEELFVFMVKGDDNR